MTISILDCTLRDGGYVNNWNFPQKQTTKIIKSLNKSNVDIVELGYLDDKNGKPNNSTLFNSVESVSDLIDGINLSFNKVVMINLFDFDVNELPQQSKTQIDGIRLAFHKKDIQEALVQAQKVIDLGYQLFFQPMVTKSYSDEDFLSAIKQANQLKIYAFYIVDSFGSMSLKEFKRYSNLANDNLREDICLGYHSHNNMQLAFSNAIDLCSMDFDREVIVDSSIYGMGRGAGNLNTELIADYLNTQDKKYNVIPLLEIIDELLTYYFKRHPWGFSPAQYLSASLDCHPNYASYLVNKKTNHIADIRNILEKISPDCKNDFDKNIVDALYQEYLLTDKVKVKGKLEVNSKKVLLIASGSSVHDSLEVIRQKVKCGDYLVIALNHQPEVDCDYYFFSNQQRFDEFKSNLPFEKQVITTNIRYEKNINIAIRLKDIAYINGDFVTNVAILMINYLILQGVKKIEIAGLDGYHVGKNNYTYNETSIVTDDDVLKELNNVVSDSLLKLKSFVTIDFITSSIFE